MAGEKYYFNGPNAVGVLKVAKGKFIEYGGELPINFDPEKIKEKLKLGQITTEKSATAMAHDLEKSNAEIIKGIRKELEKAQKENKKLESKIAKLETEISVYKENSELLELSKGDKK